MEKVLLKIIIGFCFLVITVSVSAHEKILQLTVEGKSYKELSIQILRYNPREFYKLTGQSTDGFLWTFLIPDSLSQGIVSIQFRHKPEYRDENDLYGISFFTVQGKDTLQNVGDCNFDIGYDTLILKGKYQKTVIYDLEDESAKAYFDLIEVNPEKGNYMYERFKCPYFGFFNDPNDTTKRYNNFISEYIASVKENPHSVYFPTWLAITMSYFQSVEDIRQIYDLFSFEIKNSYFGEIINKYIILYSSKFENYDLPVWNTGTLEPIIQDFTKINMIVFSASWCAPCHEMIPSLKEIYNDLKDQLDITYISMDEEKTADNWRKLMKEQAIPWRSLMAEQNIKTVQETYNPSGAIPFALLVYPNKTVEIIDIRQDDQKGKIYSICNSFSVH